MKGYSVSYKKFRKWLICDVWELWLFQPAVVAIRGLWRLQGMKDMEEVDLFRLPFVMFVQSRAPDE